MSPRAHARLCHVIRWTTPRTHVQCAAREGGRLGRMAAKQASENRYRPRRRSPRADSALASRRAAANCGGKAMWCGGRSR
ncbi:hypothetical protein MRX96_039200 [Rhipicephalus microplus]